MSPARSLVIASFCCALTAAAVFAQAPTLSSKARVVRAGPGGRLAAAGTSPLATVQAYLRSRGYSDATVASLVVRSSERTPRGVTHLRAGQLVGDLQVYGVYVKASFDPQRALVSLIENLVPVPAGSAVAPRVSERDALGAALKHLFAGEVAPPGLEGREGPTAIFQRTPFFHRGPRVTAVAVPRGDGLLGVAYLVETWTGKRNLLHHTLVGGSGQILNEELRTNHDSYKVFLVDPGVSAQTAVSGPGAGNAESPSGWLFGSGQTSLAISGNNVSAYLDTNADNQSDGGGTAIGDANFLADANLAAEPSDGNNTAVSVQNLFYLNNVIHDRLLQHGFTEAAGNFQEENFTPDGDGSDSVNAEAHDGGGTDNANFATPTDGSNPRMQMFLFTPLGTHEVAISGSATADGSYIAQGSAFGSELDATGISGPVLLADDGTGSYLACERLPHGSLTGGVAIVDRGTCTFTAKVTNAQRAGAIGVIIVNNAAGVAFSAAGSAGGIKIPSVMVSLNDGTLIKTAAGQGTAVLRLNPDPPPMRDSALDSDIVWHEYGHGLTWRMIGGMTGSMGSAVGEGMSDVLALLINGNDVIGEYSSSDPLGIRSEPYTNYSRTYGDFGGTDAHLDGEIYAAIGWRLRQNFLLAGRTTDTLLSNLVDGMNYTPATPNFEDMRDGILQAADPGDVCLIWEAFAHHGVGVGATATTSRGRGIVTVTESFELPAQCGGGPLTTNAND